MGILHPSTKPQNHSRDFFEDICDMSTGISTNHLSQTTSQQKFALETRWNPFKPH